MPPQSMGGWDVGHVGRYDCMAKVAQPQYALVGPCSWKVRSSAGNFGTGALARTVLS